MNQYTTREFLTALNEQTKKFGVEPAYMSNDEWPTIVVDALYEPNAPYLFGDCDDLQAKLFLECFLASSPNCEWNLNCQLAKLAAVRGSLVMQDAIAVIDSEDWAGINPRQLLLSFIATFPDFTSRLPKLLKNSVSDFRDGIFIACREANNPAVDQMLLSQFEKWERSGNWPESGTGEDGWREFFTNRAKITSKVID